ncbi:hypothetical protein DL96DRAFT_1671895 [Flagelloscypha sp. PMI_526]|nr:hypothetical protein DL96DRAFT_1671895 [Flagelloscypha sp. PMI_526]
MLALLIPSLFLPTCYAHPLDLVARWFYPKRAESIPAYGFFNPNDQGGSFVTQLRTTTDPPNSGEPLNAIISANSDPAVLVDSMADGGLRNYFTSFNFSGECLGQHQGEPQIANLGDGRGWVNESAVIRFNYGDPQLGTCTETIKGGDHFRYWVQSTSKAIFMAFSYEKPVKEYHDPVFNGYNLGRDYAVGNITNHQTIPTAAQGLINGSMYDGYTSWNGYTYYTLVRYMSGYLANGSVGINHNASVGSVQQNVSAVDGLVAVLEVQIKGRPPGSGNSAVRLPILPSATLALFLIAFFSLII